jgi:hypothetical protein
VFRENLIEKAELYLTQDVPMPLTLIASLLDEGIDVAALEASLDNPNTENN